MFGQIWECSCSHSGQILFGTQIFYISSFVATKLSFVFFYLEIFPSATYRNINYVLGCVLVAEFVGEIAVVCSQCAPLRKAWDIETPGKCLNLLTFFYVTFAFKLVTDIVLFALPIPMLKGLKVSLARKAGVMLMFSLGLL